MHTQVNVQETIKRAEYNCGAVNVSQLAGSRSW